MAYDTENASAKDIAKLKEKLNDKLSKLEKSGSKGSDKGNKNSK